MKTLDLITWVFGVGALVALPFAIFAIHRRPLRSMLIFGVPLLICLFADLTSRGVARAEVLDKLDSFGKSCEIRINSVPVLTRGDVLEALKNLHRVIPHDSHPTKRINLEIVNNSERIALSLARDSSNSREYWVFYPRYYLKTYIEIGRIVTPVFDKY